MYVLCQYTLTIYGFLENRKYHQEMEEALPPETKHDHLGNEKYVCIVCRIKLSCNNNK